MRTFFRYALMGLVLVLVALASAVTTMRFAIHGQEVQVPTLIGFSPSEAERKVTALGLQFDVERQYYSPQIAEGRVMSQLPVPGTKVRRGWLVRVAESLGPQRVSIPDVDKESERAAELNIRRRGLDIASIAQMQLGGTPGDQVLAQSPPANASQVSAPKISLLVSEDAAPQAYVMPSFVNQPLGTVSRTLQDGGFKLGTVTVAPPPSPAAAAPPESSPPAPLQVSPASIVVSQSPPMGQKVFAGAVVNLEVR
ncbi:MAG TPA: PASTA domain-containing protein [Candidatus Aquilonibacter sp.]|nr:PASTA domain-containing protein [Candidatus Aquilonibacter sp.]